VLIVTHNSLDLDSVSEQLQKKKHFFLEIMIN